MKNFGHITQASQFLTNRRAKRDSGSRLRNGLLMANVGLLLIIFAEWDAGRAGWGVLLYIGGGTLCVAGIILIGMGMLSLASLGECRPRAWGNEPSREAR
jgi:hypothetical protein